jgi:hypothetical protein
MNALVGAVTQGCDASILALVVKTHGAPIVLADVESIAVTITNLSTATPVSGWSAQAVDPSTVIYASLQTSAEDPDWTLSGGYNFRHDLPGSAFPAGKVSFAYDCTVTLTTGAKLPVKFILPSSVFQAN